MREMRLLRNRRGRTMAAAAAFALLLLFVELLGCLWAEDAMAVDFARKNLPPCGPYPFGTDWMGRDMMRRTAAGISMSIRLGLVTAAASALLALLLGLGAAVLGPVADKLFCGLVDLVMGIPHMLLLILISYGMGRGFWGVAVGIALTHWPSLARLIRAEAMQIRASGYVEISRRLGKGGLWIAREHMLPQIVPRFLTGLVLLFPHAILHEASITFLGFGLATEEPAVGIILSESMRYLLTGKWWLAAFPGLALAAVVLLFEGLGQSVSRLLDPGSVHE